MFYFLVFIPRNNSYVTKQIPMPFWVAGATRLCDLCGKKYSASIRLLPSHGDRNPLHNPGNHSHTGKNGCHNNRNHYYIGKNDSHNAGNQYRSRRNGRPAPTADGRVISPVRELTRSLVMKSLFLFGSKSRNILKRSC